MKRYYQLSMLQVWLAMAVMALFVALNIPNVWSETEVLTDLGIAIRRSGWPLHYYTLVGLEFPTEKATERFLYDRPGQVSWWMLWANVLTCGASTLCIVSVVGKLTRRARSSHLEC